MPRKQPKTEGEVTDLIVGAGTAHEVLDLFAQLEAEDGTQVCWFCAAENGPTARTCGFCNHLLSDGE